MNNNARVLSLAIIVVLIATCGISMISDSNADVTVRTESPDSGDLTTFISSANSNEDLIINLKENTTYSLTGGIHFNGSSLTINGNKATIEFADDNDKSNITSNQKNTLILKDIKFTVSESDTGTCVLCFYYFTNAEVKDCTFDRLKLGITTGAEMSPLSATVSGCIFSIPEGEGAYPNTYALDFGGANYVKVDDCKIDGYDRGINVNMNSNDASPKFAKITNTQINDVTGKCGIQFAGKVGYNNTSMSNCTFTNCSTVVSIHESAKGQGNITSCDNTFEDCGSFCLYSYKEGMGEPRLVSANDTFEAGFDERISVEGGSVSPPTNGVQTLSWYSSGKSVITTEEELKEFATLVNSGIDFKGKIVELGADIVLSRSWTPIGFSDRDDPQDSALCFRGTFNGAKHTISGLTNEGYTPSDVSLNGDEYVFGLFGYVCDAKFTNVILKDVAIDTTSVKVGDGVGALIGYSCGILEVSDVTVSGSIKATDGVGGIVGRIYGTTSTMTNCENNASVTATGANAKAGGISSIVSKNLVSSTITDCKNVGPVTGPNSGGIIGYVGGNNGSADVQFIGCQNEGAIKGNNHVGGISGYLESRTNTILFRDCINSGNVTTEGSNAGGIVGIQGQNLTVTYDGCVSSGNVTSAGIAGGIIGASNSTLTMMGCSIEGKLTISATDIAAGLVGYMRGGSISSCVISSDLTLETTTKDYSENKGLNPPPEKVGSVFMGVVKGSVVGVLREGSLIVEEISDPTSYELISSFYGNGGETITFRNCTTSVNMTWMSNQPTSTVVLEKSDLAGMEFYSHSFKIVSDAESSMGVLTAGAKDMVDSITSSKFETKTVTATVTIASGTTLVVGSYNEINTTIAEGNWTFKGMIKGEDANSHMIVKDVPMNWDGTKWVSMSESTGMSGTGTESDPFIIDSFETLKSFRDDVNKGNAYGGLFVKLGSDISMNSEVWIPIGNGSGKVFKGTFDGDGKTISGLKISGAGSTDLGVGLFGVVDGGTVRDLTFVDIDIDTPDAESTPILFFSTGGSTFTNIDTGLSGSADSIVSFSVSSGDALQGSTIGASTIGFCSSEVTLSKNNFDGCTFTKDPALSGKLDVSGNYWGSENGPTEEISILEWVTMDNYYSDEACTTLITPSENGSSSSETTTTDEDGTVVVTTITWDSEGNVISQSVRATSSDSKVVTTTSVNIGDVNSAFITSTFNGTITDPQMAEAVKQVRLIENVLGTDVTIGSEIVVNVDGEGKAVVGSLSTLMGDTLLRIHADDGEIVIVIEVGYRRVHGNRFGHDDKRRGVIGPKCDGCR